MSNHEVIEYDDLIEDQEQIIFDDLMGQTDSVAVDCILCSTSYVITGGAVTLLDVTDFVCDKCLNYGPPERWEE